MQAISLKHRLEVYTNHLRVSRCFQNQYLGPNFQGIRPDLVDLFLVLKTYQVVIQI